MTGVIIFVKQGSLSQLTTAFVINGAFLLMHINIEPYVSPKDGRLQFCSLLSILFTLFIGILMKANMQVLRSFLS